MIDKYIKAHKKSFDKQMNTHFKSEQFITKEQIKEMYCLATVDACKSGIQVVLKDKKYKKSNF